MSTITINSFCPEITSNGNVPENWEDIDWSKQVPIEPIVTASMEIILDVKTVVLPPPPKKAVPEKKVMTLDEYRKECERKRRESIEHEETQKAAEIARVQAEAKAAEEAALPASTRRNRHKKELAKARKLAAIVAEQTTETSENSWSSVAKAAPKEKLIRKPVRTAQNGPQKPTKVAQGGFVNTTLILKNLPHDCSEAALHKFFSKCGAIRFINLVKKGTDEQARCTAFIRFFNREGSDKGLTMNEFTYADRKVYVEYAVDRRENPK